MFLRVRARAVYIYVTPKLDHAAARILQAICYLSKYEIL